MERKLEISNSEWVILRILLNQSPLGSREIMASIPESTRWSTATVKTLLSRLVSKKAIGYTQKKNAFLYFPLITEMEYVRNETKSLFAKIYGGLVVYETDHFQFFGGESKAFIISIAIALETNFSRISDDLSYTQTKKHMVYVHSSFKVMQSALGYENGPSWMTAGWFWEILHIAPEETFKHSSFENAILHVLTQLIMHFINPYCPFWLVQGIAVYEARWLNYEQIKKALTIEKNNLDLYSAFRIPTDYDEFKQQRGYEITCSVIQFIVEKYDKKKLIAFLKAPESLRHIFECLEAEFWASWLEFLQHFYLNSEEKIN